MRQNFSTPRSVARLLSLYTAGLTPEEISRHFHCKPESVVLQIQRFRLERDDTRTTDDLMEIVYEERTKETEPRYRDHFVQPKGYPRVKLYREYVRDAGLKLIHNTFGIYGVRIKR